MRNNDRLPFPSLDVPEETSSSNLAFPSPVDIVDLPSEGKLYPVDSYLHGKESLELKIMGGEHEDILTDKALLRKGLAIDRFLVHLFVDRKVRVEELLLGDKNALLASARINGLGAEYKVKVQCPACQEMVEESFSLTKAMRIHHSETPEGTVMTSPGVFSFSLPVSRSKITIRLLTSADEKWIRDAAELLKRKKLPEANTTSMLGRIILDLDSSPDNLGEAARSMRSGDITHLIHVYNKIAPSIEFKEMVECPECGANSEVNVPITDEFFWPKSRV
jgi:hypothetical protein